jgi:predicted DNA-binding protein
MPSQKPRIALTLSSELHASLFDLSKALGRPMATITVEFLEELIPQFEGITKIAKATKVGNKAAAKRAMVHMLGDNMAEMMAMQQPELFGKSRK